MSSGRKDLVTPKLRILIGVLVVALPFDQLCKFAVESRLVYGERVAVLDGFFYITHARNPGAAFGLFASMAEDGRLLGFALVSLIAIVLIAGFYHRLAPGDRIQSLGLSLVLAGAAGNFIDRVWRGEVVDFLHFRLWPGYAWPDFNAADLCIILGVAALMTDLLSREALARAE
jgi:signal peptidase II